MLEVVVANRARQDIKDAVARSRSQFGPAVAADYAKLIAQALADLAERPALLRREDSLFEGCLLYHIKWSLRRARRIRRVRLRDARHFLLCDDQGECIHVLGLVHDQRDIPSMIRDVLEIGEE